MKRFILVCLFYPIIAFSQNNDSWHHLDPEHDKVLGISTYRAYEYMKDRKHDTVIVAIIDNGVELSHEDLKGVFWINSGEIIDNRIDDDHNGYIDDIHGWNFIGNTQGKNLKRETTELTRQYSYLNRKYKTKSIYDIPPDESDDYKRYQIIKVDYKAELKKKTDEIALYKQILLTYHVADEIFKEYFKKSDYSEKDVRGIKTRKENLLVAKDFLIKTYDHNLTLEIIEKHIKDLKKDIDTRLNPEFKNRKEIVGDNPHDITDTIYGNNIVNAQGPYHGTGVSGIVGALNNEFGIDGIAKYVKLMILRIVPNGDERDKDVALAIRYAIRNGADIINCSFAKKYSAHPDFVEKAIHEAEEAGVLIVIASGNTGTNLDEIRYYPSGRRSNGQNVNNCIKVGASLPTDDHKLVASFSNYGQKSVDVYAPGYKIKSCVLNNGYDVASGASIAAPVVTGMAAVLKAYFPHLNAKELKEVILKSVYVPKTKQVILPGEQSDKTEEFCKLSVSGGIVNLFNAILLVEKEYVEPE